MTRVKTEATRASSPLTSSTIPTARSAASSSTCSGIARRRTNDCAASMISPKLSAARHAHVAECDNFALIKTPPKTWMNITKPEYGNKQIGEVFAASGGTTWTRIMFERQVLGEDYWKRQAATNPVLYPSGAPMSDALVRGEIVTGPLLYNAVLPKQRAGAPVEIIFAPEGAPVNPYASSMPRTAAHPNAAKLFLNWCLSDEGQTFMIKELGNLTSLKNAPVYPEGFDPKVVKLWLPSFDQYVKLHASWVEEWNKTYGYRQ